MRSRELHWTAAEPWPRQLIWSPLFQDAHSVKAIKDNQADAMQCNAFGNISTAPIIPVPRQPSKLFE